MLGATGDDGCRPEPTSVCAGTRSAAHATHTVDVRQSGTARRPVCTVVAIWDRVRSFNVPATRRTGYRVVYHTASVTGRPFAESFFPPGRVRRVFVFTVLPPAGDRFHRPYPNTEHEPSPPIPFFVSQVRVYLFAVLFFMRAMCDRDAVTRSNRALPASNYIYVTN